MGRDTNDIAKEQGREAVIGHFDEAPPYEPPGAANGHASAAPVGERSESKPAAPSPVWPAPLNLVALAGREPSQPAFIINDWLPAGYATMLAGHGGAGKSSIALYLCVCIAAGLDWMGKPVSRRRVMYLSCEDRADVLHWRLSRICAHLGVDLAELDGWLNVVDLVGHDTILWRNDPTGVAPTTPAFDALSTAFRNAGAELLVVDGISDTFGGNENDRAHVKAYVNSLLSLIDPKRGAVLVLGHVNKPTASASNPTEGYSGSTQWHNAVRARWYLYPETTQEEDDDAPRRTGDLRLQLQKSNLGSTDQEIGFRWSDDARLFVGKRDESGAIGAMREKGERQSILDALAECEAKEIDVPAALQGPRTAHHVLSATRKLAPKLGPTHSGRKRFRRRLEELHQFGEVDRVEMRRGNGRKVDVLRRKPEANRGSPPIHAFGNSELVSAGVNAVSAEAHQFTHSRHKGCGE